MSGGMVRVIWIRLTRAGFAFGFASGAAATYALARCDGFVMLLMLPSYRCHR